MLRTRRGARGPDIGHGLNISVPACPLGSPSAAAPPGPHCTRGHGRRVIHPRRARFENTEKQIQYSNCSFPAACPLGPEPEEQGDTYYAGSAARNLTLKLNVTRAGGAAGPGSYREGGGSRDSGESKACRAETLTSSCGPGPPGRRSSCQ